MVSRAEETHRRVGLVRYALREAERDVRLADTGLARQEDGASLAPHCPPPTTPQQFDLFLPAQELPQSGIMARLEAALDSAWAQDFPRRHRLRKALQRRRLQLAVLEMSGGKLPRCPADHNGARLGEHLKPGRQIGGVAEGRMLLSRTLPDEFPDDNGAGRDADPDLKPGIRAD